MPTGFLMGLHTSPQRRRWPERLRRWVLLHSGLKSGSKARVRVRRCRSVSRAMAAVLVLAIHGAAWASTPAWAAEQAPVASPAISAVVSHDGAMPLTVASATSVAPALPFDPAAPLPTLAPMIEQVLPAVVSISTRARVVESSPFAGNPLFDDPFFRRFFDVPDTRRERITRGLGSGVIVDAERGRVLTNFHVIARAESVAVTLADGREFDARVVGGDERTDVALLEIDAKDLQAIEIGDPERLRVGDFVVAIGNPFGLGQTVTSGIVSALGRSGLVSDAIDGFIQTDASINPGNSGGALVDLRGHLVGINTAILSRTGSNIGIGFAIPIDTALLVAEQLASGGALRRGVVGLELQDLTGDLAAALGVPAGTRGAVVVGVVRGSEADRAGLVEGDVVTALDGREITSAVQLKRRLGLYPIGRALSLVVIRDGQEAVLSLRIGAPATQGDASARRVTLDHPRLAGAAFALDRDGVVVAVVETGSPAARLGLRAGDRVLALNGRAISDLDGLTAAAQSTRTLQVEIQRGRQRLSWFFG